MISQTKMMMNKAHIEGVCACLRLPVYYVTPAKWQPAMLGSSYKNIKCEDKTKQSQLRRKTLKELSLSTAKSMFPDAGIKLKKDDGKSDSILIAKYGKDYL